MAKVFSSKDQWYVIHVFSGHEQKVRSRILNLAQEEGLEDYIFDVLVPMENVSEIKAGKRKQFKRNFYPGYIIVNMYLLNEKNEVVDITWNFIKRIEGVIRFAGTKGYPSPMSEKDVNSVKAQTKEGAESIRPMVEFKIGDTVNIDSGAFKGELGEVEQVDSENGKLKVSVTMFGRSTLVELEYWEVSIST